MDNKLERKVEREFEPDKKFTIVQTNAAEISAGYRIAQFRGRAMIEVFEPYPHFVPLNKDRFEQIAYPVLGGVSRSRMSDVFAFLCNTAEDLTDSENLVLFGMTEIDEGGERPKNLSEHGITTVWDMDSLDMSGMPPSVCVWRSPYAKIIQADAGKDVCDENGRLNFIMDLAGNDNDLYDDIMQSIAPLVMKRKPDGVIWWVGDGANGKSTLMDAIYKIFPGQLSSITVKRLVDGRDTPSLNGTLGNIVKESSEGRVDDTEVYKSIGTHENFRVHKFHSQDDIEIRGNVHHIFSANLIPSFNDKGYAARRRTFVIPFKERFESDPMFEERTFTPEMFGRLITEMCKYAIKIKKQGYRYKWSAKTLAAKADYDAEASNAEEYAKAIISEGVVAFESFNPVRVDYENWCADNGYVPLGVGNLRRALQALSFERMSVADESGQIGKYYRLPNFKNADLQQMGMGRPGLFTVAGFEKPVEDKVEPEDEQQSIIGDKW